MDVEQVSKDRGECPDAEQLAAYVDGTLEGQAHDAVEAHLADCDRCVATLGAAIRLRAQAATGGEYDGAATGSLHGRRFLSRQTVVVTGSLLGMAAAFILMTREQPRLSDQDQRILSMVEADLAAARGGDGLTPDGRAEAAEPSQALVLPSSTASKTNTHAARGRVRATARIASPQSGASVELINQLPTAARSVHELLGLPSTAELELCLARRKRVDFLHYLSAYVKAFKADQPLTESAPVERASTDATADCVKDVETARVARLRERNELTPEDEKQLTASSLKPPKP